MPWHPVARFRLVLVALLLWAAGPRELLGQSGWNVRIKHFVSSLEIPAAGGPGMWIDEPTLASTFTEGEAVVLVCQYEYTKTANPSAMPPWTLEMRGDGKVVKSHQVTSYQATHAATMGLWLALSPGPHQARCGLDLADDDPSDNAATVTIHVVPRKGTVLGVLPTPPPTFLSPAAGARFLLGPALEIPVRARIPATPFGSAATVAEYAKSTPMPEKWRLEIRRLPGSARGPATLVGELEGTLSTLDFGTILRYDIPPGWLADAPAGAGRYAVRAYLVQVHPTGIRQSPATVVEFELAEQLVASLDDQPPPEVTTASTSRRTVPPGRIPRTASTTPFRLTRAAQHSGRQVTLWLAAGVADPDVEATTVELRLGRTVVGRAELGRVPRGKTQELSVPFEPPAGTSGTMNLEVWAGGRRIGTTRVSVTGTR